MKCFTVADDLESRMDPSSRKPGACLGRKKLAMNGLGDRKPGGNREDSYESGGGHTVRPL